jgi:glycosyltransferase involved in cell wall biosynthesis
MHRVFFYARPPTPRRAFELGLLVLEEVVRRVRDVEVVFAGWDISDYSVPFKHSDAGLLSLNELPDLYSQCDVALVLSLSNLSLLPLELMACGTPVVSNQSPSTEWLLNKNNARLAPTTVDDLADAVCAVLNDPTEANRLREGGFATVAATDWHSEARKMADILRGLDTTINSFGSTCSGAAQ